MSPRDLTSIFRKKRVFLSTISPNEISRNQKDDTQDTAHHQQQLVLFKKIPTKSGRNQFGYARFFIQWPNVQSTLNSSFSQELLFWRVLLLGRAQAAVVVLRALQKILGLRWRTYRRGRVPALFCTILWPFQCLCF